MHSLIVGLSDRSYPIYIGSGILSQHQLFLPYIKSGKAVIISNTTVAPLYLEALRGGLEGCGISCSSIVLQDGEQFKTPDTINTIYNALLNARCDRGITLIALGGGVIGDMVGFAAATYLRGVPFIQIPTTLLAQVDSSVGGKTGINHPLGKNMIGAFYQPKMVLADTLTLNTLADKELKAGLAEVIKYGLIRDLPFFEWLEINIEKLLARDAGALNYAIERCCRNKSDVVGRDELESGERALLNLGHTFGHAIENAMGYGVWLHGEAVAAGTMMAADLSRRMGWLKDDEVSRVRALFTRAGLPVIGPRLSPQVYIESMGLDKKVASGKIHFVLLRALGDAVIESEVPMNFLVETLQSCQ